MDWKQLPYDHAGRWAAKYESIMHPGTQCNWPQLIVQWVISNCAKFIKTYPKIVKGKGWSVPIAAQVRSLSQQSSVICNYFPHPDDDPLVEAAFRNFFKNHRVFRIGSYRKVRETKKGKCNITQAEKDLVKGLMFEYQQLKDKEQRVKSIKPAPTIVQPVAKPQLTPKPVQKPKGKTNRFSDIMEIESQLHKASLDTLGVVQDGPQ